MYVPASSAVADLATLHDFIDRHSFGLLVSPVDGIPFATHLPLLLDRTGGPHGTLVGHFARANPHWHDLDGQPALAVFSGPHAYVSPSWYEAENVVPTWNYTAVHATGRVRLVHDKDALQRIVRDMTARYESAMPRPWTLKADEVFVDRMLSQIVGFRVEIEAIEGKFKLNQNHPTERRAKVVRALREQGGENATEVAAMIHEQLWAERAKA